MHTAVPVVRRHVRQHVTVMVQVGQNLVGALVQSSINRQHPEIVVPVDTIPEPRLVRTMAPVGMTERGAQAAPKSLKKQHHAAV